MYGCLCGAVWSRVDSEFCVDDLEQLFEDQDQQLHFEIKASIIWGSLLPIHFNAISIHMHMLMNRLESIYLDIDYPILDLPMGFACG